MSCAKIVFSLWKIMGLCPYRVSGKEIVRFSYIGLFYSTTLAFAYSICFVKVVSRNTGVYGPYGSPMAKISDLVANSSECCMVVITWLTFAFSQRRFASIQKSFRKITNSCAKLGISEIPDNAIKRNSRVVIIFNSTWSLCFLIGNLNPPEDIDYFIWIAFNLGHVVFPNFIILYIGIMQSVHDLFRLINKKLREISEFDTTIAIIRKSIRSERSLDQGIESFFASDHLATLGRVHTELVELTRYIISLLSPSLYTTIGLHLFQMSTIFYAICVGVREARYSQLNTLGFLVLLLFGLSTHCLSLIAEFGTTASLVNEANDTGNVLHEVVTSQPTKQNIESATIWSLRMLQNPLNIKLFGVLPVKPSLFYSIVGSVTGYATIMLQLDDLERPKNIANT